MNKEKWNVLLVHNYYKLQGGEDSVVQNEKNMLEENGNAVFLYTRSNNELNRFSILKKVMLPFTSIFNFKSYFDIKKIIKENNIDIVYVHNTISLISYSVYYAAQKCNVPVVQTLHNYRMICPNGSLYRNGKICKKCRDHSLINAIKYKCYRNSYSQTAAVALILTFHRLTGIFNRVSYICLTEFSKSQMEKLKIEEKKIFIKPNFCGQQIEFIKPQYRKNQIVYAGRLTELKGIPVLLEAWKLLKDIDTKLIIFGSGELAEYTIEYIKKNKINAEYYGVQDNITVIKEIAYSKGTILATQWYECFPMSIVESFSVGTPVLASDIGNTNVLVENNVNGFKFIYNNPKSVAMAVKRLLKADSNLYFNTLNNYKEKYSKEINYNILVSIFQKVKYDNIKNKSECT